MSMKTLSILILILTASYTCEAQADTVLQQLPNNYLTSVTSKLTSVDKKLSKQTLKALRKFERLEAKLKRKLAAKDSTAKTSFENSTAQLQQLATDFSNMPNKAIDKFTGEYNAYLDTLKTTFKFITEKGDKLIGKSKALTNKLSDATSKLNVLQGKFQKAEEIKKYIRERKQQLRQQFDKLGIAKELKKLDKVSYYYSEYINEYKGILKDKKRLEKKAMALLYSTPIFKKFVEKNSMLASLFRIPTGAATNNSGASMAGIQTRASVQQLMQTSISAGGPNAMSQVRQQIQAGQAELSKLKDKIAKYGSADGELPSFKPNNQKVKSFFKRLEYGGNIQFGAAKNYMPSTSTIAFSLGYKLTGNGSIGIGGSYILGMGNGWKDIKLSSQGIGLRSYIDWKLKGNIYISGGYEQNYYSEFKNLSQLQDINVWQTSGLLGLSKKVKLKGSKSAKVQVLYDFLSYRHTPSTQPFIFRTGISLK